VNFEDEPVPGYPLPILPGHTSPGRFERVLRAGQFAVTSELAPPDSADPEDVYRRARVFHGYVDAINATDGSGANCHMSSLAVCALLTRVGYAPIMQISCRDKNRIAIQGDILGGAAMGVCNILCLTGDGVNAGQEHKSVGQIFVRLERASCRGAVGRPGRGEIPDTENRQSVAALELHDSRCQSPERDSRRARPVRQARPGSLRAARASRRMRVGAPGEAHRSWRRYPRRQQLADTQPRTARW